MNIKLTTLLTFSTIIFAPLNVTLAQGYNYPTGSPSEYCHRYATDYAKRHASGGRLEGAAEGALGGAIIGAIAGDAGTGAAVGAAAGGIAGGASQKTDREHLYRRAYDDCMRDYHRR